MANNIFFSDTYCLNDIFFVHSALLSSNKILFIEDYLYCYYHKYSKNRIPNNKNNHKNDLITVFDQLYMWLDNKALFNDFKNAYFKIWKSSFIGFCRYEYDENFVKHICEYLSYSKPWSDMSAEELYINCKFDNSITRLKLYLTRIEKALYLLINKETNSIDYRIDSYSNIIGNVEVIREKLNKEYDKRYTIRDDLIESIVRRFTDDKKNA